MQKHVPFLICNRKNKLICIKWEFPQRRYSATGKPQYVTVASGRYQANKITAIQIHLVSQFFDLSDGTCEASGHILRYAQTEFSTAARGLSASDHT